MTPRNQTASLLARLLNISKQRGEDYVLVLRRYAVERFLFRLSRSEFVDSFVLKGAMLHMLWGPVTHRSTRDLDVLAYGSETHEWIQEAIGVICRTPAGDDGLEFDLSTLIVEDIREGQSYGGMRAEMTSTLGKTRIPIQVDIAFGDIVVPQARVVAFPSLLNMGEARIRAYTQDSVVAEKLHAMVILDMANSRMKDYFDLWVLSKEHSFNGTILVLAIQQTFNRRKTAIPVRLPAGLSDGYAERERFVGMWERFVERSASGTRTPDLLTVVREVREFVMAPMNAAEGSEPFDKTWAPGGPWV